MTANSSRLVPLLEAFAFTAYVAWYIWQLQAAFFYSWLVFPLWLAASFALHKDTPRSLGWRADNLWSATKRSSIVFLPCIFWSCVVALLLGGSQRFIHRVLVPKRFFSYMAFCLLQ